MSNKLATATLEITAENAANNAVIQAAEGEFAQSELSSAVAADCLDAIAQLRDDEVS